MSTTLSPSPASTPLRKKRNFKALQLPTPGSSEDPVATRQAPAPLDAKKKPPILPAVQTNGLTAPSSGARSAGASALLTPESSTTQRRNLQLTLTSTLEKMEESKAEAQGERKRMLDVPLRPENLKNIAELGMGNGGSVMKVEHVPTGIIMAKKIVLIDAKPSVRKQILRELHIMHSCDSPYIVSSFGAFLSEPNICICMEFMDKGSFDGIYKRKGAIDINIVGMVATSVLEGLTYLYDVHHIIHRDIKPSNILLNSEGEIKLCDFGVSGELINSIANTFVGTSVYMSPERIQGAEYSVKSDVWSLGITLVELAHGHFPFSDSYSDNEDDDLPSALRPIADDGTEADAAEAQINSALPKRNPDSLMVPQSASTRQHNRRKSKGVSLHGGGMTMSILELMHQIVREPAPRLTSLSEKEKEGGKFPKEADEFVDACLIKEWEGRKMPKELLKYEWIEKTRAAGVDVKKWAEGV